MISILKRLEKLEEKILTEKNALQKYFEKNPEKIKKFGFNSQGGSDWKELANSIFRNENNLDAKYLEVLGSLESKYPNCFKDIYLYNYGRFDLLIKGEVSLEEFKIQFKSLYERNSEEYDQYYEKFVKDPLLKRSQILKTKSRNYCEDKFRKLAKQYGFDPNDLVVAFNEIFRVQSMSFQRLKTEYWGVIKALTVDPNNLPKVIYRGFFMDGAKIKDPQKFLSQWSEGSYPNIKLGKPTSWSTSKATASSFMTDQSNIKDLENGYHILIKLTNPTEDELIGDFRNFEFSRFWNQQELMINPEVKRYQVEKLIRYKPYEKGKDSDYANFNKQNRKPGSGSFGSSKKDMLINVFDYFDLDIDPNVKINYKFIKDSTLGELLKSKVVTGIDFYDPEYGNKVKSLVYPLYSFFKNFDVFQKRNVLKVKNSESIKVELAINFDGYFFQDEPYRDFIKDSTSLTWEEAKKNSTVFCTELEITLVQNSINRFVFEVSSIEEFYTKDEDLKVETTEEILEAMNSSTNYFDIILKNRLNQITSRYKTIKIIYK